MQYLLAREIVPVYSVTAARSHRPLLQCVQGLESRISMTVIKITRTSLPGHIASLLWHVRNRTANFGIRLRTTSQNSLDLREDMDLQRLFG